MPSASETLQSVAFATVLDLLCEGEIQGLVNGVQSIFLNGVPLQESNGTNNFVGTTVGWVNGSQAQPYIPGFSDVEATNTIGAQVMNSLPISSQIDNPEADAVIITLGVGGLSNTDASGDISGTSVELRVAYQPTNGSLVQALDVTFDGYATSRYERSYRFPLTGTGPWTVTVTRVTPDSQSVDLVNPSYVDAVTTVVDTKLSYPNSALVGFQIDARQFSSIPARSYLVQGMLIQVPNNYNPLTRLYSGVWDGGFQIAYSNNPAWCLYDMLTSDRYGLGLYVNTGDLNTVSLYEIGQYCDELVPDGFGGQEPRFTLNTCITNPKNAYDVIQDLCSAFRGMTYWGAGTILATQDSPWQGPMPLFSPANVVGGQFTYAGSMRKDRHTVAYVTFNDPAQQYIQATEYVEDPDGIVRYGVRAASIVAVGCTSRGQAHRMGAWQLQSELLNTDQVQFQGGLDAAQLTPGTVIQIADPVRAGERMGGRVVAGTMTSIALDAPVTLDAGQTYTLSFMDATGAQQSVGIVNTSDSTNELTFTTAAPAAPNPGFMWALSGSNLNTQLFRVVNVQESAQNTFDVLAISYNESKFDVIDFNTALQIPPISLTLSLVATTPTLWTVTPATYLIAPGTVGQKLILSWSGNTAQYLLEWRANGGPWNSMTLKTPGYTIMGVTAGDVYDFQVVGLSVDGSTASPLVETYTVPTLSTAPGAPSNLTGTAALNAAILNWSAPSNLDLNYFQVYMSQTNDVSTATVVATKVGSTTWTVGGLTSGQTYYFWVNAVNTSGLVGPFNSNTGTAVLVLYIQPGDFNLSSLLYQISTSQYIGTALLAEAAVTNANIAAQAVATNNIQDAAISTGKIANGAVTATQIANAAIGTAQIANAAITTALIDTAAVGTAQIQDAAITSALIAYEAVGTANIQQEAVGYAQIATAAVGTLTIGAYAVTTLASWNVGFGSTVNYAGSGGQLLILFGGSCGAGGASATASVVYNGNIIGTIGIAGDGSQQCNFCQVAPAAGNVQIQVGSAGSNLTNMTVSVFEAKR